jgi:hypothetical protein
MKCIQAMVTAFITFYLSYSWQETQEKLVLSETPYIMDKSRMWMNNDRMPTAALDTEMKSWQAVGKQEWGGGTWWRKMQREDWYRRKDRT